jgi:hypothetical protein
LPADRCLDEQVTLASGEDASDDATGVPQQLRLENMEYAGFQMQTVSCHTLGTTTAASSSNL